MDLVKFFSYVAELKRLKRSGWAKKNVESPETVASHSYGTAILCMILAKNDLEKEKVIKMALIHDLAESIIGDMLPDVPKNDKHDKEEKAMKNILKELDNEEEYFQLWLEFEESKTNEARFVKDIDKLDMALQANIYKDYGTGEFLEDAEKKINDPEIKKIVKKLKSLK